MPRSSRVFALVLCGLVCPGASFATSYQASFFSGTDGLLLIDSAGMNNYGDIAGWGVDAGTGPESFLRSSDGAITTFRVANNLTFASSINDAGQVAGSYQDPTGVHAFVRATNGQITNLQIPYATFGFTAPVLESVRATGINDSGQVVGTFTGTRSDGTSANESFLMLGNGSFLLIDLSSNTYVTAISNNGYVLGYSTDYDFVLNSALQVIKQVTNVPTAVGYGEASLTSINDNGDIVGSFDSGYHAFISNISSTAFISLPSPQNCSVGAINDSGAITGTCGISDEGFVLTPVPEPASILPLTAALLAIGLSVARKRRPRTVFLRDIAASIYR